MRVAYSDHSTHPVCGFRSAKPDLHGANITDPNLFHDGETTYSQVWWLIWTCYSRALERRCLTHKVTWFDPICLLRASCILVYNYDEVISFSNRHFLSLLFQVCTPWSTTRGCACAASSTGRRGATSRSRDELYKNRSSRKINSRYEKRSLGSPILKKSLRKSIFREDLFLCNCLQIDVNFVGTLRVTKFCLPLLKAGEGEGKREMQHDLVKSSLNVKTLIQ